MWIRVGLICACALALAADKPEAGKTDQDKIQGKWTLESGERGGQPLPEELVKSLVVVFDGNKMKFTVTRDGQERKREMTFTLDSTKKPKAIDVEVDGNPGLGIYSLEGDKLKICHSEAKEPRPTEFATKADSMNSLLVLKRAK